MSTVREAITAPEDVTTYDDLQTLSDDASLAGLVFYEVRSVRRGSGLDDYIEDERHEADDEDEENGRLSFDAQVYFRISADQTQIEVRQRVDIVSDEALFTVDAGIMFDFPGPISVAEAIRPLFIERVGLMALHPYVRESVTAMSSKLNLTPIILPLMRTFSVDELDPADAVLRMGSD
ncbi:hypothetical protein QK290_18030 [Pseudarthrobacter sp. AL07]|uniref:hypothetical protein n=1 Tax=unclassified Pseudarthrobacter TaxID=2647000 RepID=UPI00249C9C45|nr:MULTISPECIES: hypothetical protein [unclassified Pseudarthrobacter]MDI3196295.1 hypothetical protein [Pseudarthrobacter sp. AL20]MDI3210355.1 hypothetical protein [Pseudarthrobacter sp. AL07]